MRVRLADVFLYILAGAVACEWIAMFIALIRRAVGA